MKRMPLFLVLVGLSAAPLAAEGAGVSPHTATKPELERAQSLFLEGKAELDAGKPREALGAFRASYETVASPNSHLFVARCLSAMGDHAAAYREYALVSEGAAREAVHDAKYAATQTAAEAEKAELRSKLGFVVVRLTDAPPDASVDVGGLSLSPSELVAPVAVNPGLVEVVGSSQASARIQSLVMIAAGEEKEVALAFTAVAEPAPGGDLLLDTSATDEISRKRMRTAAFIAGGVGAAGLVTFAVAGSMARSQYSTLQDECAGPCPQRQSDIDAGRRSQTIANIGLAVGAVGLGTGTVLYLVSRPKAQDSTVGAASLPPLTAEVAAGPSWLGVRGTFR